MSASAHWEGEPRAVWAELWGVPTVESWEVIGSTNDRARDLVGAGAALPAVVLAEEQRAGRGRSGARWHSPPSAGLWISLALAAREGPSSTLPLRVGLAAARACEDAAPGLGVGIKWPNDLEIDGRKIGGILCERVPGAVVVGVGLNVRAVELPTDIAERATSLETEAGGPVSRARVASVLVRALVEAPVPTSPLDRHELRELAARDVLAGRRIWTEQSGEGVACGVEPDGALLLDRGADTPVRVVAGSVRSL